MTFRVFLPRLHHKYSQAQEKKKKKKNAVVAGLEYKAKAPFEFVSGWSHLANIRITIVLVKYK